MYVVQTTVGSEKQIAEKLNRFIRNMRTLPALCCSKSELGGGKVFIRLAWNRCFRDIFLWTQKTHSVLEENVHRLAGKAQLLMGGQALAIESSEEILFKELLRGDSQHTVRRFLVQANEAGEIVSAEGILGELLGQIVRKRFRKRVVTLEIPFLGKTHQVELSIRVKDDREKTMKEETI